jgi:parallel beta-helix repeat protein
MKRVYLGLTLLLILCLLPIPTHGVAWTPEVGEAEQVFFEENFESYNVGTFPSSGGWELWYSGAGTEHQVIVDDVSVSPTKALKLLGVDYWAGFAAKRFTSTSSTIGFEVAVRVEENSGQPRDDARVAFTTKVSSSISREYAPVTFQDSGVIISGGQVLQSYVVDRWYKIKVIMDRDREAYSVWVDGELKGENLAATTTSGNIADHPSYEIEAFSVSQCYNSVTVYFDDVKVFEVSEVNPRLELVPDRGIVTTTLVGSGFAPNSKISVTWDGTPITTAPSPIIADGYGNFTAIISVSDQTYGTYTVKAVDGMGNEAATTFTVTLRYPSQTYITVPDDYPTIQEAINHAKDGDTIVVKAGTYHEHVTVNKTVSLLGEDKATTIIDGNGKGVVYVNNDYVHISGFTIKNAGSRGGSYNGLHIASNSNTISNNIITSNSYHGVSLVNSNHNFIINNEVFLNHWCGIVLTNSDYNIISGNTLTQNRDRNNGVGIKLQDQSNFNTIQNNVISKHAGGIGLTDNSPNGLPCYDNLIKLNYIFNNEFDGIFIYDSCERNTIQLNNLTNNGGGIHLLESDNNVIVGNNISHSSYGGIGFEHSKQNSFYHNNLIENTPQIHYSSINNAWDNGSEGNYWSDYIGVDYNGDGIGDTPYIIDENNRDNYPLTSPYKATTSPSNQITVDTAPPNITDVSQAPVSVNGTLEEGARVTATVTDAAGEVERVALKYSDGNGTWVTAEMTKLEGDVWVGTIPPFPHGTNVTYTIIAEDTAGNTVTTEELSGAPNQYETLPEFQLWLILPLFVIATASALVAKKRVPNPVFTKICNRIHRLVT